MARILGVMDYKWMITREIKIWIDWERPEGVRISVEKPLSMQTRIAATRTMDLRYFTDASQSNTRCCAERWKRLKSTGVWSFSTSFPLQAGRAASTARRTSSTGA